MSLSVRFLHVIFFAVEYLKNRKRLDLILTTVFCGVCTAQKYTAALTCLIVIALVVSDHIYQLVFGSVGIQALLESLRGSSLKWRKAIRHTIIVLLAVVIMCIATDVWLDMIVKALPDTRYISAKDLTSLDEKVTTDNSYIEWWTPLAPTLDYDVYMDTERMNNAEYVMVASYNYDAKFSSERFNPNVYKEDCDWYRKIFDEGELIYQIQPWIKYKLLRDVTEYGDIIYTVPIIKAFTNIQYIADYYMHPEGKYYGPLISIYKMK